MLKHETPPSWCYRYNKPTMFKSLKTSDIFYNSCHTVHFPFATLT